MRFASSPVIAAAGIGRQVRLILHAARVRRSQTDGADRPDEHANGAGLRRGARAARAVGDRVGVIGERFVEEHDPSLRVRGRACAAR